MPFFFMLIAVAACWRRRAGLDLLLAFGFPYILHPFPCILTPPSSTSSTDTFLRCLRTVDAVHLHLASGTCAVRLATFGASPTWLLLSYCGLQLRARVTPPVGCNALFRHASALRGRPLMAALDGHSLHCAFSLCHHLPFFFQETRPGPVLRLTTDFLHWAKVGRQAGYGRFLSFFPLLPHGLPVLQSIQPLPLFWLNHLRKPPDVADFFLATITAFLG